mmetsp:Transcript_10161/g.11801  ORF Transcript_10161/g.11801 Transcript_10161/m.11801 type:complete len:110 (+) Transcript_10161:72-401(+)
MIRESEANLERTRAAREAAKAAALARPTKSSTSTLVQQQHTDPKPETPKMEDQTSTAVNTPTAKEGDDGEKKVDEHQQKEAPEAAEEGAKEEATPDQSPMRSADSLDKE